MERDAADATGSGMRFLAELRQTLQAHVDADPAANTARDRFRERIHDVLQEAVTRLRTLHDEIDDSRKS